MQTPTIDQLQGDLAYCLGNWDIDKSEYAHVHSISTTAYGPLLRLDLSIERDHRLHVRADSLNLYNYLRRDETFPKMTCALTKDPPHIAREIKRRIIGEYRELIERLLERKAKSDAYNERKKEIARQISVMLNTETTNEQDRDRYPGVCCYGKATSRIEFAVESDTSVKIKIDGSGPEAALHIAHTVQEWLRYGWTPQNENDLLQAEEDQKSAEWFRDHPEVTP